MMRALLLLPLALGIAACGTASVDTPGNADALDNATAAGLDENAAAANHVATIDDLPEGQQKGVLFRAIRDAGQECQEVTQMKREKAVAGEADWAVVCDDRKAWIVTIKPDGIALVSGERR